MSRRALATLTALPLSKIERKEVIIFKTGISKKERTKIVSILSELTDIYRDFYITKNNLRLFIKENIEVLFKDLYRGDKIAYDKRAIGLVVGYSDKSKRKYVKILAETAKQADKIIKVILWNEKIDLWAKVKRNSIFKSVLERNNFRFEANRGKEILLVRRMKKEFKHAKSYKNKSQKPSRRYRKDYK